MFKVGDKIVCVIKTPYNYAEFYNHKYNIWFKKSPTEPKTITIGKSYEIISTENIELEICYYILDDNNQSDWFSTNKGYFFIYDYFYTPEELILLRLLKLESL